ncbi:hypothetical protein [Ruegeria conchae]|uniref:hypothetical protein n=1 Tax=Ruegeria conchae TaxID=981384 RepID=UPI0029C81609|nr:hypothetical protein [Ruegeria conchae]
MPSHKMAVIAIHGMGSQYRPQGQPASTTPTFSKGLKRRVANRIGADMSHVIWHEVVWAQILQGRQKDYLRKINRSLGYDKLREFVVCNLSDAASYRPTPDDGDKIYDAIHKKIENVMGVVKHQVGHDGPVLILAHSLGGHIMSNYVYDMQRHLRQGGSPVHPTHVENMKTVAGIVTFGCNIPIFLFAYPENEIFPIMAPNRELPPALRFTTWWHNYYDRHDVLGFPLGKSAPSYAQLAQSRALKDKPINAGKIFTSWNPFSHNGYWTDRDLYEPVAERIKDILAAV